MSEDTSYNSEQSIRERALAKKREDAADFYDEVAGRDNGKTSRFLSKDERDRRSGKSTDRKNQLSALDVLMLDPVYAATYNRVVNLLTVAEQETEQALEQAEVELTKAKEALADTQGHASTI
jgi:hypothetical protein